MDNNSRKKLGITEGCWSGLTEDQKIIWKFLTRVLTFVGALAVTKTGVNYLDWIIAASMAAFSFLLIESQRSYTRYSMTMRKRLTRISISLGGVCMLLVGVVCFCQFVIFALARTYTYMPLPIADGEYQGLKKDIYFLILFALGGYTVVKVFQELSIMELVYHSPRRALIKLLVHKQFQPRGCYGFVCFELGVVFATICYSGLAATSLSGVLSIINIAIGTSA